MKDQVAYTTSEPMIRMILTAGNFWSRFAVAWDLIFTGKIVKDVPARLVIQMAHEYIQREKEQERKKK